VLGGGYLHSLVVRALVVGVSLWLVCLVVVTCMPWSLCLLACALVGVLGGGYLHALVVRALVVGRLVVGGYLCTLNLVPWWLVCPCVPWSLRLGGSCWL